MSILLKKSGILTTVQDLGRNGFRRFGINQNGAMDKTAVRLINALLGNHENTPVLEMHFPAPEIHFEEPAIFSLGGGDFSAVLNGERIDNWKIWFAEKNSSLKFEQKSSGSRAYLTVSGGFRIESRLGSTSTNLKAKFGGLEGRRLRNGDRIFFDSRVEAPNSKFNLRISSSLIPFYAKFPTVRVIAGAEFELLNDVNREIFLNENFTITQNSDRMGFRLAGEPLALSAEKQLVSSAVNFGTIQLLPDGQLIVLMADHQTSGGYPRIANIITTDLPLIAQLGANDKVAFHLIAQSDAENLLIKFEKDLNLMKTAAAFFLRS